MPEIPAPETIAIRAATMAAASNRSLPAELADLFQTLDFTREYDMDGDPIYESDLPDDWQDVAAAYCYRHGLTPAGVLSLGEIAAIFERERGIVPRWLARAANREAHADRVAERDAQRMIDRQSRREENRRRNAEERAALGHVARAENAVAAAEEIVTRPPPEGDA